MRNVQYITPTNLNGTITLFKDLGREDQAAAMLQHYMQERNEDRAFFDLEENPFGDSVNDPDVRAAFKAKSLQAEETRDVSAMLISIKGGWGDKEIKALASTPVNEYRNAFRQASGADLRAMISGALQFDRIGNASEPMKEISRRAKAALRLIGEESDINARRVRRFGVMIGRPDDPPASELPKAD